MKETITQGNATLGIELGSTRIKAVLIDESGTPLASGSSTWENQLVDGLWSYDEEAIWEGLQAAYRSLAEVVEQEYGVPIRSVRALGISAMMHGYLAMDEGGQLLVPFRTWRNTNTGPATEVLSDVFRFNVPHRWSIAHLYQALLNEEDHLENVDHITTLSGLVHERLSGKRVIGVGDASGMFPIDSEIGDYDQEMIDTFNSLAKDAGFDWDASKILPKVLLAGQDAGELTQAGATLLDPSGTLKPGILMAPPEGDAGTGMVATNAVAPRTGNVSAGTSIFAMVVLERPLARVHPELDMVTTPDGAPVAMVHSNNGASEWDQWVGVFAELLAAAGFELPTSKLYDLLYAQALEGAADGGGLLAYNFLSGEPIVGIDGGRPLFVRKPDSNISLPNYMRTQLMSIFGVLRVGMDILLEEEKVELDRLYAHGGLFKTPVVAQKIMAGALGTPVDVSQMAAEGGAWGIALLALYRATKAEGQGLADFLNTRIFAGVESHEMKPDPRDVEGFDRFMDAYRRGLAIEAAAVDNF